MQKEIFYQILHTHYEYNDEKYYNTFKDCPDSRVFRTKEIAKKYANKEYEKLWDDLLKFVSDKIQNNNNDADYNLLNDLDDYFYNLESEGAPLSEFIEHAARRFGFNISKKWFTEQRKNQFLKYCENNIWNIAKLELVVEDESEKEEEEVYIDEKIK